MRFSKGRYSTYVVTPNLLVQSTLKERDGIENIETTIEFSEHDIPLGMLSVRID